MHFSRCGFLKYNNEYLTRKHPRKNRTQATAEYVDSASDPEKQTGKSSYHPSEEIRASLPQNAGASRLSPAETTRTIIEVLYCIFQSAQATFFLKTLFDQCHMLHPLLQSHISASNSFAGPLVGCFSIHLSVFNSILLYREKHFILTKLMQVCIVYSVYMEIFSSIFSFTVFYFCSGFVLCI